MKLAEAIPRPLESDVQSAVVDLFRSTGCIVYILSQGYREEDGGTRQTPGIPDLWVFVPRRHTALWFECKRPRARRTNAQVKFGENCAACSEHYAWGGVEEAKEKLREWGLVL